MALVTYADLHAAMAGGQDVLSRVGERIADDERPMPPPPNTLSDADRDVLQAWIDEGGPPAKAGKHCELPDAGPRSVYVDSDAGPDDCQDFYEFRAHGDDDASSFDLPDKLGNGGNRYQCFYFDVPWEDGQKALWLHTLIDNTRVLHHWILYGTDSLHEPSGTSKPCSAIEVGAYFIAGWAPGGGDVALPSNVEMDLPSGKGAGLVLEVHYFNTTGESAQDQSGVRVCTAPSGTREQLAGVHFTGSEGICVPPSAKAEVSGMCDPRDDRGDIHIIGAWPHMHKLGRRMKISMLRADGTEQTMHDAPFDFASQEYHPFAQDEWILHPGDKLRTDCFFQNETNQPVPFGQRTQDEMCYGFITAWPAGALENDPNDLAQLVGGPLQQERRCMDPLSILQSCNGLADVPQVTGD